MSLAFLIERPCGRCSGDKMQLGGALGAVDLGVTGAQSL